MPAPTALLQAPAPELVAAPALEQQDELLVDMQEASAEPSAVAPPTAAEDTDMAIDEEGRPRFAPGKDVVGR
jgi:RNA-binding protein PNO1